MKQLLVVCCACAILSCSTPRQEVHPTNNMSWADVDSLLKSHIKTRPDIESGLADIRSMLAKDSNQHIVSGIDISRLKEEFRDFLRKTLKENPLPRDIKGLSFGLFTMAEGGDDLTTLYLCGSTRIPPADDDWAVGPEYFPRYYCVFIDFESINEKYSMTGDQEVLVFNGITNLLIINIIGEFRSDILRKRDVMYVGAGFDEGDTYIIGKLTKDRLQ